MESNLEKIVTRNCDLIVSGRQGMMTEGKTEAGRKAFVAGIQGAISFFKEVQVLRNPTIIMQAEHLFVQEQMKATDKSEKLTISSLNMANTNLIDAKKALVTAHSSEAYGHADTTHSHAGKNLTRSVPKDVFHQSCASNKARLQNGLRTPGLSLMEKDLLAQRASNMDTAKEVYIELQQKALGIDPAKASKSKDKEPER